MVVDGYIRWCSSSIKKIASKIGSLETVIDHNKLKPKDKKCKLHKELVDQRELIQNVKKACEQLQRKLG